MLAIAREIDPSLEPQYNKHYIGIYKGGQPFNFSVFRPRKNSLNVEIKLPRSDETDAMIEKTGIEALNYNQRWQSYSLSLEKEDLIKHREFLKQLMQASYQFWTT